MNAAAPARDLVKWVSLNAQTPAIRLVACKKAWNVVRLEIAGSRYLTEEQCAELAKLGFYQPRRAVGRLLVRKELRIGLDDLRRVFPNAAEVMMPLADATHVAPARALSPAAEIEAVADKLAEVTVIPVGHNERGETVYESDEGRYVVRASGESIVEGDEADPTFLRADTPEDLARCADGFVRDIEAGRYMRGEDLRKFASTVTGIAVTEIEQSPRMRQVQEAVEAALVRALRRQVLASVSGQEDGFAAAKHLVERQPAMAARTSSSVMLQQYSSPLPMAYAAQVILGRTAGRSILEPTIGNGALVCASEGARVVGVDLDGSRLTQLGIGRPDILVHEGDATTVDFVRLNEGKGFDAIMSNPPFGKLDASVSFHGLKVNRIDHLILMRSLAARKDEGVGVYIIGADSYVDARAGKISGTSRYLFNWLADHYEVDVVEVPGRLFAKQGATFPTRMVVVGRRGEGKQVPDEIPVLQSDEELFAWAQSMGEKYAAHLEPVAMIDESSAGLESAGATDESDRAALLVDLDQNTTKADENSYQSPYPAMSRVGEPTAMVPRNLLVPTQLALAEVVECHGDIDEFVASQLDWSVEQMARSLSPEQVDALALAMHAEQRSGGQQGFLMGDQTGQGKGRFLAAMARYHVLQGRPVVFLTETPTLFTDFWRDIRAIGSSDLFRPMIVNAGVGVYDDVTGHELITPTPASIVSNAVATGEIPSQYNLVLGTYSQFSRDRNASGRNKSHWITVATKGCALILDESHNAAGESNTNTNASLAVDSSYAVVYSSATSIKEPRNLSIYSRLFPRSVAISTLPETLAIGGEALQEVLSSMLARDGVFIRREHDLSNLDFKVVLDNPERVDRNRSLSDHLAGILEGMNYLAGDINKMVSERNAEIRSAIEKMPEHERKGNRMGAVSINYFSRLFNIYRQFLLALQTDLAGDQAVAALHEGKKPVFVLENTMETMLNEVISGSTDEEELTAEALAERIASGNVAGLEAGLTFRDVLHRTLDKLCYYEESDRYGERHKVALASEGAEESVERLRDLIDEMPVLAVSPIDVLRHRIESAGFKCSELTGRKMGLRHQDGQWVPYALPQVAKAQVVQSFNAGDVDAVVLSRAGSTGVSLHSAPEFPDKRQRVMLEVQLALDVNKRVQFHGRVNRRGQLSDPQIQTFSTGLPGQARPIAMANAKLRKLSANTTSNQENASLDASVPDFLNSVGDAVAFRYLESHPDIARRLDIELDEEESREREPAYFVNKLTSRLVMLRVDEQEEIYAALTTEYNRLIAEMDEKGVNPLRSKEVDLRAREVAHDVFEAGDPSSRSCFSQPIYLRTVEMDVVLQPMRAETVESIIAHTRSTFRKDSAPDCKNPIAVVMGNIIGELEDEQDAAVQRAKPAKFKTVEEALGAKEPNACTKTRDRYAFLTRTLCDIDAGRQVIVSGNDDDALHGVIVAVGFPQTRQQLSQLSAYTVRIAVPGNSALIERSLYALREDPRFEVLPHWNQDRGLMARFDEAPEGKIVIRRHILDGNLFAAAQLAAQRRFGSSVVYTDSDGKRHRGVLLAKSFNPSDLAQLPLRIETPQMLEQVLDYDPKVNLTTAKGDSARSEEDVLVYLSGDMVVIQCPGTKARGGHVFANEDLTRIVGEFAGSRASMSVKFPRSRLLEAAEVLSRAGVHLYAPPRLRQAINEMRSAAISYNNESYMQQSGAAALTRLSA